MTTTLLRRISWPVLVGALASPLVMNCGAAPGGLPGVGALPGACPDFSSADAVAKIDFASEFKMQAEAGAKLKGGVEAAVDIKAFADQLDADLKAACGGLANDLGAKGDYKSGEEACKAAIKAMGDIKGKMGASAKIALTIQPPRCDADMNIVTDCAAKCDAKVKPGSVKAECEGGKLSGECTAECSGTCDMKAAATCEGTCEGSCDASFSGTCGGKCDGKCDGKDSKGECAGKCEGKCDAKAKGECKGKCGGSCELKAKAKCDGTCTGSCSVEMKAPKCSGEVKPPEMSAECKGHCDAQVNAKLECKPAQVGVVVVGAADAKLAATYKAALEKNLPGVLKIAIGMGDRAAKLAGNIKAVVEGVQSGVASASSDAAAGARLAGCVAAPFKGALDAAASVKANVNVSVDVKASASASGSAGGSAGGKAAE